MDYISRQAVIGEFNAWIPMTQQERETLDAIMQTLNEIPAAKVIPVDWIIKQIQEHNLDSVVLSRMMRLWRSENGQ